MMIGGDGRGRRWLTGLCICLAAAAGACGDDRPPPVGGGPDGPSDASLDGEEAGGDSDSDAGAGSPPLSCVPPPGDAAAAAAACTDLMALGGCIDQIQVDDSAPAPAAGDLLAGTYNLTERILYTSPGGATGPAGDPLAESLSLSQAGQANDVWSVDRAAVSATAAFRSRASARIVGAAIRLVTTCPTSDEPSPAGSDAGTDGGSPLDPPGELIYYTASASMLTLFRLGPSGPVRADSYARR